MRKSKKQLHARAETDQSFERLYRTIPAPGTRIGSGTNTIGFPEVTKPPKEPKKKRGWKKIIKRIFIFILIIVVVVGGWLGWKTLSNIIKVFGWKGITDIFSNTKLKGEDAGRVNILLAGNSADDPGHGGAELTDSIMVVSIDTKDKTGYIMSVPRDLYVAIPGHGYAKINEAYPDGKNNNFSEDGYARGGMGLLEKTISQDFNVQFNYYALIDYAALQQAVDAVGGIQVTIQSTDPRGLYDPSPNLRNNYKPLVRLPNGVATLNGVDALALARARGDSYGSYGYGLSDFTRTDNQRKILLGLKDKATSLGTLSNPVKIGQLMDSFGNNVQTDFNSGEVRRLYTIMQGIPSSSITSVSLNSANGKNLLTNYRTSSGQSALVPAAGIDNYSQIQAFLDGLMTPPPSSNSSSQ